MGLLTQKCCVHMEAYADLIDDLIHEIPGSQAGTLKQQQLASNPKKSYGKTSQCNFVLHLYVFVLMLQLALSAEKILLTFNQFISIPVIIHFLFIFFTISQMQYNVKELISLARRPSSCFDKEGKLTICRMLRDGKCIGKNSWHWQSSVHVCLAAVVCSLFQYSQICWYNPFSSLLMAECS